MINNEYSNIIGKYVNEMKSNFKQELKMILIIGSSCSEKVIKNWSDIDVILVFDEIDIDTMEKVREIASSYKIKIGITVYNKVEFLSKKIPPSENESGVTFKIPTSFVFLVCGSKKFCIFFPRIANLNG